MKSISNLKLSRGLVIVSVVLSLYSMGLSENRAPNNLLIYRIYRFSIFCYLDPFITVPHFQTQPHELDSRWQVVAMGERYAFGVDEPWKAWVAYAKAGWDTITRQTLAPNHPQPSPRPSSSKALVMFQNMILSNRLN